MRNGIIIALLLLVIKVSATNISFCDPELSREVEKISKIGGTYLKDFMASPEGFVFNSKMQRNEYKITMVLSKGCTYRFYLKSSNKIQKDAILTLKKNNEENQKSQMTLIYKPGEHVAYEDVYIENDGAYHLTLTYEDQQKGCALIIVSFMSAGLSEKTVVDTSRVYEVVDQNARFQGSDINEFRNYVAKNFVVDTSLMKSVKGKMYIQFTVNTSGKTQDIKVVRSCGNYLVDMEGILIVKSSPVWKPARLNGIDVKQSFVIPIKIN